MWISIRPCFKNPGKVSTIGLNHRLKSGWQMQVGKKRNQNMRFTPLSETSNCLAFLLRKCIRQHGLLSFHELFSRANHFTVQPIGGATSTTVQAAERNNRFHATACSFDNTPNQSRRRIVGTTHLPRTLAKAYRSCCSFIHSFIHSMLDLPLAMAHESF